MVKVSSSEMLLCMEAEIIYKLDARYFEAHA